VAPTSIPTPRSKPIKTDRIDAAQLAQFYAHGLLMAVRVPEPTQEHDRDLLRTRQHLVEQHTALRKHRPALLRRHGLHDKAQTHSRTSWTLHHSCWLERTIAATSGSLKVNLELLVRHLKDLTAILTAYDQEIEELATTARYEKSVQALTCDQGIKQTFALTIITEIGDITRFAPPRHLVAWMGMDIRDYASGGHHHRDGITKHGHRSVRTAFIEANQRGDRTAIISKALKARRAHAAPKGQPAAVCRQASEQSQGSLRSGNGGLCVGITPQRGRIESTRCNRLSGGCQLESTG